MTQNDITETAPSPLFEPAEIERLKSEIGEDGVRRLLDLYQLDLERRMGRMEAAFAQHDYATLAAECHALRSATMAIGLTRFASELTLLEVTAGQMAKLGEAGPLAEAAKRRSHLHVVLAETRPHLTELARIFAKS